MNTTTNGPVSFRYYQLDIIQKTLDAIKNGYTKILIVLAAGGGKTLTYGGLLQQLKGSCLIAVPFKELKTQVEEELVRLNVTAEVATIQSIVAGDPKDVDLFIYDESHHSASPTHGEYALALINAKILIGVTATPYRVDHKPLLAENGGPFECVVMGPSINELTEQGYLAQLDYFSYPLKESIEYKPVYHYGKKVCDIRKFHYDIDDREEQIVEEYARFNGAKSFVFCHGIKHAEEVSTKFNAAGIPSLSISCHNTKVEREHILSSFRNNNIKVLTAVNLMSEGINVKDAKLAILNRKISGSLTLFIQQVSRVLRPYKDEIGMVLDLKGNIYNDKLCHPNDIYNRDLI